MNNVYSLCLFYVFLICSFKWWNKKILFKNQRILIDFQWKNYLKMGHIFVNATNWFSLLFYSPTTVLFICTLVVEVLKMGTKTNEPLLQQNWSWCCSLQIQQLPFLRWAVLGFIAAAPCASPAWCLACSREKF